MFVKPAVEGSLVRIPERDMRPLNAEGEEVPENSFWHRRILQGDVIQVSKHESKSTAYHKENE